jgi:hypothetical protein
MEIDDLSLDRGTPGRDCAVLIKRGRQQCTGSVSNKDIEFGEFGRQILANPAMIRILCTTLLEFNSLRIFLMLWVESKFKVI